MSDAPLAPYNPGPNDDEISISELLLKLWAKRGLIVFLPLIFAGLTVVGLLVGKTGQQTSVSLFIELNGISLTSAVKNGEDESDGGDAITTRYPNGVVFSPQDLMNPSVIRLLSQETNLASEDLAEHIDVQFGTPLSNGVLTEYAAALSASSKASSEELAVLNERYKRKLDASAKRGLKITVDFIELGISKDEGKQLAGALPKLWNQVYTEQFRTLLPSKIMGLRWTHDIHDLTSTIGLQEADIQIEALTQGIDAIIADERLIGLKNRDGVTASDISTYISRFRAIYFEPLFLAAFQTDSSLTKVYERDIGVEMKKIDSEIQELNARIDSLQRNRLRTEASAGNSRQDFSSGFDGGAMSQVVSLAEQASSARYLQATLEKRFELVEEKAVLQARLERMIQPSVTGVGITSGFVEMATARYETIVRGYGDLLQRAKEMVVAATPSYYSVTTQPQTAGSLISKRDLLFIALALALGGMLAVVAALVWPQHQEV